MKNFLAVSVITFLLTLPLNLIAQDPDTAVVSDLQTNLQYGFGLPFFSHNYEEPELMEESGLVPFTGVVGFVRRTADGLMLSLDAEVARSQVKYVGQAQDFDGNIIPVEVSGISDFFYEVRFTGGPKLSASSSNSLVPYTGLGARWWSDGLHKSAGGYYRQSRYFYSPIGLWLSLTQESGGVFDIVIEYDYFWKGRQKSRLSDVSYESLDGSEYVRWSDATNIQNSGVGLRASATYSSKLGFLGSPGLRWGIRGFVRYWDIDDSDISRSKVEINIGDPELDGDWWISGIEPANNTLQFGMVLMLLSR